MTEQKQPAGIGLSGQVALVAKTGEEGALMIDAITGQVIPDQSERPEWSSNLVCALFTERHAFYKSRLGEVAANAMLHAESYNVADLAWVALDEEGEEIEVEADAEHRMEIIAEATGLDRDEGTIKGGHESLQMDNRQPTAGDATKALPEADTEADSQKQRVTR